MSALFYGIPLSLLFMTLSNQWTIDGFIVGYVTGTVIMLFAVATPVKVNWISLPQQLFWLIVYIGRLTWDILLSGIDVSRRVLDPRLPINPGRVVVETHDKDRELIISALSAHAITVTPGEVVEDFEETDKYVRMVVHTLNVDATSNNADNEQLRRMQLLKRIKGGDV
jgi:multicomponent Na+:H+ antiporter subunit E